MPNQRISELANNAAPDAAASSVPIVRQTAPATFVNERVTLANVVKAGVSAGGVGLSAVATSGSYTDLLNQPSDYDGGNF